jgi:phospholipid transport system substrate-binding protein
MSLRFAIALLLSIICLAVPVWAEVHAEGAPMEAVRTTVGQALRVLQVEELKKPERTDERVSRLRKIANSRFDYGEMAKRSLGGQWDKLGASDRQEFVDLFTELLTTTYAERINAYSDEEVTFLSEQLEGDYAEVKTVMVGKKTETLLNYRLIKKHGDWKAYDVVVDGISLVSNYRGQFTAILRASSYEQFVQILREKIVQYNMKTKIAGTIPASR